jgi:hypothetical protein
MRNKQAFRILSTFKVAKKVLGDLGVDKRAVLRNMVCRCGLNSNGPGNKPVVDLCEYSAVY